MNQLALLQAVPHTPALLAAPAAVSLQAIQAAIASLPHPQLQRAMLEALEAMLQNPLALSFRVLQGARAHAHARRGGKCRAPPAGRSVRTRAAQPKHRTRACP